MHNLCFAAAGIIGNLIGTVLVQRIVMDAGVADSIRVLVLKLLLVQSLCAILVLVVSTLRSKSLGMILAVLFGLGLTSLKMTLSPLMNISTPKIPRPPSAPVILPAIS